MAKGKWMIWLVGLGLMTGSVGFANEGVYQFSDVEEAINQQNSQILRQLADTELLRLQKETLDEQKVMMEPLQPILGSATDLLGGETALQLISVSEYLPAQLDSGIRLSELGVELARNAVMMGARQLVLGIMQTQQAGRRAREKAAIQEENWNRTLLAFEKGMATEAERLKARADCDHAKLDVDRYELDRKDYMRRLNQLMGYPIESEFVFLREKPIEDPLLEEAIYLESGLSQRFEIIQVEESLILKERELGLYETYGLKDDSALKTTYQRLQTERDQLLLQLQEAEDKVEVDVRTAYRQVVMANQQRIALTSSRDAKRTLLANLRLQQKQGFVSQALFDGTENALKELEEGVDLLNLQYNTARLALDYASQVGPGSGSGVTP